MLLHCFLVTLALFFFSSSHLVCFSFNHYPFLYIFPCWFFLYSSIFSCICCTIFFLFVQLLFRILMSYFFFFLLFSSVIIAACIILLSFFYFSSIVSVFSLSSYLISLSYIIWLFLRSNLYLNILYLISISKVLYNIYITFLIYYNIIDYWTSPWYVYSSFLFLLTKFLSYYIYYIYLRSYPLHLLHLYIYSIYYIISPTNLTKTSFLSFIKGSEIKLFHKLIFTHKS